MTLSVEKPPQTQLDIPLAQAVMKIYKQWSTQVSPDFAIGQLACKACYSEPPNNTPEAIQAAFEKLIATHPEAQSQFASWWGVQEKTPEFLRYDTSSAPVMAIRNMLTKLTP